MLLIGVGAAVVVERLLETAITELEESVKSGDDTWYRGWMCVEGEQLLLSPY